MDITGFDDLVHESNNTSFSPTFCARVANFKGYFEHFFPSSQENLVYFDSMFEMIECHAFNTFQLKSNDDVLWLPK